MITLFEDYNSPDLRKMSTLVLCTKNYKKIVSDDVIKFEKGKAYKVLGMYGDPQGAIEKYGIVSYVPIECIHRVIMFDNENIKFSFDIDNFLKHFEILDIPKDVEKYNI